MTTPEDTMREVVTLCANCDCCRYLMDTNCLFFPEIYKLWDREQATGEHITPQELRRLADLCNYCALCPCPNIRESIIKAKTEFIDRDGVSPHIRILEDVERVSKMCGTLPQLSNYLLQSTVTGGFIKKSLGIHPKRKIPLFPAQSFPSWAKRHKLVVKPVGTTKRKVAYFAGCSARYIYPELAKAVVSVFQRNGIEIYYPTQQCCGMPSMLEGDRKLTLTMAARTVANLVEVVDDGYDIVCSCPTCGYMIKQVLKQGAYYSAKYQDSIGGDDALLKIPATRMVSNGQEDAPTSIPPELKLPFGGCHMVRKKIPTTGQGGGNGDGTEFLILNRSVYGKILKDDGYFSAIDPLQRIMVAENTHDLGEYLLKMHQAGDLDTNFGSFEERVLYYPPCHLREQDIGMPYPALLSLIPGMLMESLKDNFYCCGMAGIMGCKREFHNASLRIGSRLIGKIKEIAPDKLITDCLSCRLQFNQITPYEVLHPVEILRLAYETGDFGRHDT
jgi:glycerol-3-phosphate dehydrogenase subunit C